MTTIDQVQEFVRKGQRMSQEINQIMSEQAATPVVDLANFEPRCAVCTNLIPKRRQHGNPALGGRDACSAACGRILKAKRRFDIMNTSCANCRHPSSPQEREEFKQWRKARGDVRLTAGNPNNGAATRGRRVELYQALRKGMGLLKDYADPKMTSEVREFLEEAQNLIDGNANSQRKLRGSSTAASTEEKEETQDGTV